MAIAPLPFRPGQGGYYSSGKRSANINTLNAGDVVARLRWPTGLGALVLLRLRVAVDLAVGSMSPFQFGLAAYQVRGFSQDFTANLTSADMQTNNPLTGTRHRIMGPSLMGPAGPGVCSGSAMTGAILTCDNDPFAITPIKLFQASSLSSAYSAGPIPAGACSERITLYEWQGNGDHPLIFSGNDGVVIKSVFSGLASATIGIYVEWDWGENLVF